MIRATDNYEFPTDQVFHDDALVYLINDLIKSAADSCLEKDISQSFSGYQS